MEVGVKEWMSGDPVAVEPSASALEALDLMTERGIRHLPVVDAGRRVVGVVSVDDLRAALPFPYAPRQRLGPADRGVAREWLVGEIMTHAPQTLTCEASLAEAAELMAERRIGCLPIVEEDGRLAGLLSETDVLHALATSLRLREAAARRTEQAELDVLVAGLRSERKRITKQRDGDDLTARRLEALDRALGHAAQGRFGVCEGCGGRIPVTRLQALPGTTLCVACAREVE